MRTSLLFIVAFSFIASTANAATDLIASQRSMKAPIGMVYMCYQDPELCNSLNRTTSEKAILTDEGKDFLMEVNQSVNDGISQETDSAVYGVREKWTLPRMVNNQLRGDCEDLAMEKHKRLVAAGWDKNTLRLGLVNLRNNEKHIVLVVDTDQGSYILDNLTNRIVAWENGNYDWIAVQGEGEATKWDLV